MLAFRYLPAALAALLLILPACATTPPSPSPGPVDPVTLDGRIFLSTSVVEDGTERQLVPGTRIRLSFGSGQLGADAGCNSMGAPYDVVESRLVIGQMSTTEIGCDPQRHEQDEWLSAFMGSRPVVTLDGATLVIDGNGTVMTLLDREVADPDMTLVGPLWVLDTVVTGDVASSVPAGVSASLRFDAGGWVEVDTGCNTGGGNYTAGDRSIVFAPIGLTRRACLGAAGDVERMMLNLMTSDAPDYDIEARSLTVSAGALSLVFRASD